MSKWENEIDNLKRLIEVEKLPYDTIGKMYGVSGTMIRKIWKKFGFNLESRRKINEKETFNKGKKLKPIKEKPNIIKKEKKQKESKPKLYCVICGKN